MLKASMSYVAATLCVAATAAGSGNRASAAEPKSFEIYGFAQADYVQDFRRVNPAWDDTLRPSRIPTTEGEFGSDGQAIVSVRQSRFGAKASLPVAGGDLSTQFEFDLFGVGVDEGQTTIRLRHAYGQWKNLLAGQTHSLFMDIDVFPNTIDYWGPSGMVFLRNPQLRWTVLPGDTSVSVAIEKPGNDIDPGQLRSLDPDFGDAVINDEKLPDLTAQFRTQGDWGHLLVGGILRSVGFETLGTPGNEPSNRKLGWGVNVGTHFNFRTKDRLILSGVYGEGIASYMNDGGTDLAPEGAPPDITAAAVPLFGVVAYYDLFWSDTWSSSFGYSRTQVENTGFQAGDAFFRGEYISANLLYSPDPKILMGAEALWGRRTDNDGDTGTDTRVQFSVKYSFSSKG